MKPTLPILPPAMLGILGGGQLGRMFALAAKTMGYRVTVLDPDPNAPAAAFADRHLCAPFDDAAALAELAECAAVTTEFENVNADAMRLLAQHTVVSPSGDCVAVAQNRILEKERIRAAGLQTAPYQAVRVADDLGDESAALLPGILKTATLGYDGKGQIRVNTVDEAKAAFAELGGVACVLEKTVDLRGEISVVVCRLNADNVQTYDPAENIHENGILAYSIVPARLNADICAQVRQMAVRLAHELDYVGVLAVEMFVVGEGADERVLVNELAMRPHNTGHWTIDGAVTSQFEQHLRAVLDLPLGSTQLRALGTHVVMVNLLGSSHAQPARALAAAFAAGGTGAKVHLYGKEVRPGRKLGHVTVVDADPALALERARAAVNALKGETPTS